MRLDLRECETVALSLPEDTERRASVEAICERVGLSFRILAAIRCQPGRIGCGLSHLRALRLSKANVPLLILEDDVGVSEPFTPVVEIPDDADALYLGGSVYGAVDIVDYVGFTGMLAADVVTDDLVRVYNLLGTHAILYLTERFKLATAEQILRSMVDRDWAHDKGMAVLQESHNVYALARPPFFQAAGLQTPGHGEHQEGVTRVSLEPLPVGARGSLGIGDTWRTVVLVREQDRLRWCWAGGDDV